MVGYTAVVWAVALLVTTAQARSSNCRFDFDDVPPEHIRPMLARDDKAEFVYPVMEGDSRILYLEHDSSAIVSCPGKSNLLLVSGRPRNTRANMVSFGYIKCNNGSLMNLNRHVKWSDLSCHKKPQSTITRGKQCGHSATDWTIGWQVRRRFVKQITLCFSDQQETPLFTVHHIHGRNIDAKVVEPSRPSFRDNKFFSFNVKNVYVKTTQLLLLQRLLNTTEHLTSLNQHYLAKGHLAPDADFILEPEQDATYQYANVVPQWQAVNNGNWKKLESAVRRLAKARDATLEVWTGAHGVLKLPSHHDTPISIFLGLAFDRDLIPVPALMWKVIHDPGTHTAVAIVMVNDVGRYGTFESWSLHEPPCSDLCHQLPWVNWDTSDPTRGRTFCCAVDDLRSTISDIPSFGPVSLLY